MRFIRTFLNYYYHHHRVKLYVIQLGKLLVCRTVVNNVGVKQRHLILLTIDSCAPITARDEPWPFFHL